TATISFPASNGFYNAAGWGGSRSEERRVGKEWGAASVADAIKEGSGNYYDGSGFNSASIVYNTATGTTGWSYAIAAAKLSDGHTYHITVKTTDNTTTRNHTNAACTRNFSYDSAAPTATISFPASNGFYNAAGWGGS